MKYPMFSNWVGYKRIPDLNAYYVKNYIYEEEFIVPPEDMSFAKKLDGKTDPYSVAQGKSHHEVREDIRRLSDLGLIRNDRGIVRTEDGFIRTLIYTKNSRKKRIQAWVLNVLLMAMFLPVLLLGQHVYRHSYFIPYYERNALEQMAMDHASISIFITVFISVFGGIMLHELCHGIACRAYGGRVFEYGIKVDILPGFYTLMNDTNVKSKAARIQIAAAGVEGNLLFAGVCLLLTGLFPGMNAFLELAAKENVILTLINLLPLANTDGAHILTILSGYFKPEGARRMQNIVDFFDKVTPAFVVLDIVAFIVLSFI